MLANLSGRQLAGWGYALVWIGMLVELINVVLGALAPAGEPLPFYAAGLAVSLALAAVGIRMMTLIKHRPW